MYRAFPLFVTQYGLLHFTYPKDSIAYESMRAASSRKQCKATAKQGLIRTLPSHTKTPDVGQSTDQMTNNPSSKAALQGTNLMESSSSHFESTST